MDNKLVSVIITTYKREPSVLKRAIVSVLNQTYQNIELIIVNDDPDPVREKKILELIDEIGSDKIQYFCNEVNSGACVSRNVGIKKSHGDFIALLDDDDEWKAGKLECMLPYFQKNVGLVYSAFDIFRGNNYLRTNGVALSADPFAQLLKSNFVGGCSIPVIRKVCFDKCGYFDESLPSSQDVDMWRRIALHYELAYVSESTVNYYIMSESITRNIDARVNGWMMQLDKFSEQYKLHPKERDFNYRTIVTTLLAYGQYSRGMMMFNEFFSQSVIHKMQNSSCLVKGLFKRLIFVVRGYV